MWLHVEACYSGSVYSPRVLPSNDNDPESCPRVRAAVVEQIHDLQRRRLQTLARIRLFEADGGEVGFGAYLYLRKIVLEGAILKFERMLQGSFLHAFQSREDRL